MTTVNTSAAVEELEAKLASRTAQIRDLATMGAVITSILEMNAVLSVTMDMAIRLVDGEVGVIMIEEDGELRSQVSWGVGDQFVKSLIYEDGLDLPTYCFRERQTVILTDLEVKSEEGITLDTVLATPIRTRDKCLGVAVIINKANGGNYTDEDREALSLYFSQLLVIGHKHLSAVA